MPTPRPSRTPDSGKQLREALAPYVDLKRLRTLAARGEDIYQACNGTAPDELPAEVTALLDALRAMLRPNHRESITSPEAVAALLMAEMYGLEQEELRVVLLNTRNQVIDVVTVYRGTLNLSRVGFLVIVRLGP